MLGVILATALVVAVVAATVYPLIRPPLEPLEERAGPVRRLEELEERKETIYGSIRDAGLDFRTGKLTEEDYRREVAALKAEAIEVVAEIEALRQAVPTGPEELESRIQAEVRRLQAGRPSGGEVRFCTGCGAEVGAEDRFCSSCGEPVRRAT